MLCGEADAAVVESSYWTKACPQQQVRDCMYRVAFVFDYGYKITCLSSPAALNKQLHGMVWTKKQDWLDAHIFLTGENFKNDFDGYYFGCLDILINKL